MSELIVKSEVFKAVSMFAAKKDIRYYICGVCLDLGPDGAFIVATDGCALAAARVSTKAFEPAQFILDRATIDNLSKAKGTIVFDVNGLIGKYAGKPGARARTLNISTDTLKLTSNEVQGIYPDWRRVAVYHSSDDTKPVFFNPEYSMLVAKAGDVICKREIKCMVRPGGSGVGYAQLDDDGEVGAWVMPYRDVDMDDLPMKPVWQ